MSKYPQTKPKPMVDRWKDDTPKFKEVKQNKKVKKVTKK